MLRSSTIGYHDAISVYFDRVFNSFVYGSRLDSLQKLATSMTGRVIDARGRPLMNERVLVHFRDGSERTVFTNAKGIYRVFDAATALGVASVEHAGKRVQLKAKGSGERVDFRRPK